MSKHAEQKPMCKSVWNIILTLILTTYLQCNKRSVALQAALSVCYVNSQTKSKRGLGGGGGLRSW